MMNSGSPAEGSVAAGARESPATDAGVKATFPWPPPEGEPIATAVLRTWHGSALDPARFFRAMPERSTLPSALLYYLPLGVVVAGVQLFWRLALGGPDGTDAVLARFGLPASPVGPLVDFLISPLVLLLTLFLATMVGHVALSVFGGARRGVAVTAQVFCYAYSPALLAVVPYAGNLVGGVWMIVIAIVGLREAHRTDGWKAALAVLVPALVAIVALTIMALLLITGRVLLQPLR